MGDNNENIYLEALRKIDTHIRSTKEPIKYIIKTLEEVLPEYKEEKRINAGHFI